MLKNEKIARLYAKAYLNVFQAQLSASDFETFSRLAVFLNKNRFVVLYLTVPTVDKLKKNTFLLSFFSLFNVCSSFKRLILMLLQQKRIELLAEIVEQIIHENNDRMGMQLFTVTTSSVLSSQEEELVTNFLTKKIGMIAKTTFTTNSALIYGIKLQSNFISFDNSVAKKLKDIRQNLLRQVEL